MSGAHGDATGDPWMRSRWQSGVFVAVAWMSAVLGAFSILGATVITDGILWARIGMVAAGAYLASLAWWLRKARRAGARAEQRGLRIRGLRRETFILWKDIERFSLGRHGYSPYVARVHLRDGSIVPIFGIAAPGINPRNRATAALIERLEEERRRHADATG